MLDRANDREVAGHQVNFQEVAENILHLHERLHTILCFYPALMSLAYFMFSLNSNATPEKLTKKAEEFSEKMVCLLLLGVMARGFFPLGKYLVQEIPAAYNYKVSLQDITASLYRSISLLGAMNNHPLYLQQQANMNLVFQFPDLSMSIPFFAALEAFYMKCANELEQLREQCVNKIERVLEPPREDQPTSAFTKKYSLSDVCSGIRAVPSRYLVPGLSLFAREAKAMTLSQLQSTHQFLQDTLGLPSRGV